MLVLSRKNRESVMVGGSGGFDRLLTVTVLDIRGSNVKLGFEVDPNVPVHRSEVWERINAGDRPGCLTEAPDPLSPLGKRVRHRVSRTL